MGCGETSIGFGGRLRGAIVEVGEGEAGLLGVGFHFLEAVAVFRVAEFVDAHAIGVIGIDGDDGEASGFQFLDEFDEAGFGGV